MSEATAENGEREAKGTRQLRWQIGEENGAEVVLCEEEACRPRLCSASVLRLQKRAMSNSMGTLTYPPNT